MALDSLPSTQACHLHLEKQRHGGNGLNSSLKLRVRDKWVKQTTNHELWTWSGDIHRAVRKREITVPGGPI